jgi:hypothetical protein
LLLNDSLIDKELNFWRYTRKKREEKYGYKIGNSQQVPSETRKRPKRRKRRGWEEEIMSHTKKRGPYIPKINMHNRTANLK